MSEFFILPNVPTQLLLREGVKVPDHLRHLPNVSTSGPGDGLFLGSLLLSKDGGELCSGSQFLAGSIAHGSALDDLKDNTLTVYVPLAVTVRRFCLL